MQRSTPVMLLASLFTLAILAVGYLSFGLWTTVIFTSGFLGGLVLWLFIDAEPVYTSIRGPYFLSLALFIAHRVEEYLFKFQEALSGITGVPVPDVASAPLVALVVASVGGWLLVPLLVKRGYAFGYYLAWTFFAAMGITELAHFILPLFVPGQPYGYFPGMATVVFLAPAAWWGMWRLSRPRQPAKSANS